MSRAVEAGPYIGLWYPRCLILWMARPVARALAATLVVIVLFAAIFLVFTPLHLSSARLYFWTDVVQSPQFLRLVIGAAFGVLFAMWLRAVYRLAPDAALPLHTKIEAAGLAFLFVAGVASHPILDNLLNRMSSFKYGGVEVAFHGFNSASVETPGNARAPSDRNGKSELKGLGSQPTKVAVELIDSIGAMVDRDRTYLKVIDGEVARSLPKTSGGVFDVSVKPLTSCLVILGQYAPSNIRERVRYSKLAHAMRLFALAGETEGEAVSLFNEAAWDTARELYGYLATSDGTNRFNEHVRRGGLQEDAKACARLISMFCPADQKDLAAAVKACASSSERRVGERLNAALSTQLKGLHDDKKFRERPYFTIVESLVLFASEDWQSAVRVMDGWIEEARKRQLPDAQCRESFPTCLADRWFLFRALNIRSFIVELARRSGDAALVREREHLERLDESVKLLATIPLAKVSYEAIGEPVELISEWYGTTLHLTDERCKGDLERDKGYRPDPVTIRPYGLRAGLSLLANEMAVLFYMVRMPDFEEHYSARAYEIARRLERKGLGCITDVEQRSLLRAEMLARIVKVDLNVIAMRQALLTKEQVTAALRGAMAKTDLAHRLIDIVEAADKASANTNRRDKMDEIKVELNSTRRSISQALAR